MMMILDEGAHRDGRMLRGGQDPPRAKEGQRVNIHFEIRKCIIHMSKHQSAYGIAKARIAPIYRDEDVKFEKTNSLGKFPSRM